MERKLTLRSLRNGGQEKGYTDYPSSEEAI